MQLKGKHFSSLFSSNILITVSGLLTGIILARNLDVDQRGLLAQILFWVALGTSFGSETMREYILSKKSPDAQFSTKCFYGLMSLSIGCTTVFIFFNDLGHYWIYAITFAVVNFITLLILSTLQASGAFTVFSIYKLIVPLLYLFLLSFSVLFELSVSDILFLYLSANIALVLLLIIKHWRDLMFIPGGVNSLASILVSVIGVSLVTQIDRLLLASYSSTSEMALFLIAFTFVATPISVLGQTFSSLLVVKIKTLKAQGFKNYQHTLFAVLVCITSLGIVFSYFSEWLIPFIFGQQYRSAHSYSSLCLALAIAINIKLLLTSACRGLALNKEISYVQMYSLFLSIAMMIIVYVFSIKVANALWWIALLQIISLPYLYLKAKIKLLEPNNES